MGRFNASVVIGACVCAVGCGAGQGVTATPSFGDGGAPTHDAGVPARDGGAITLADAGSAPDAPAVCGDSVCQSSESCTTCPNDCGQCPKCDLAPSCSQGLALPSQAPSVDIASLSTVLDGGTSPSCSDAQLRLRISHIDVGHQGQEVWLPTGTLDGPSMAYYCIMQASSGVSITAAGDGGASAGGMEVAITPPSAQIPDNSGEDLPVASSIFWGQAAPHLTQENLSITYSCYQQKPSSSAASAWASILAAGAAAAGGAANSAGPYGWAFGVGSVGLSVASAAAAAAVQQGDWHMFDTTITIDASRLLELSNGHTWTFTQSGGNSAFHYPWSITVTTEAWGCATPVVSHKPQ